MNLNDDDEGFNFKINEKFAKNYEEKKQREEFSKRNVLLSYSLHSSYSVLTAIAFTSQGQVRRRSLEGLR